MSGVQISYHPPVKLLVLNIYFIRLRSALWFGEPSSAWIVSVKHVFGLRTKIEVCRIATQRIVADMVRLFLKERFTERNFKGDSACVLVCAPCLEPAIS